jgi:hypothetical protein
MVFAFAGDSTITKFLAIGTKKDEGIGTKKRKLGDNTARGPD